MIAVRVNTDWGIEDYIFSVDELQFFTFKDILAMLRCVDDVHNKIKFKFNKADLDELEIRLNNLLAKLEQ